MLNWLSFECSSPRIDYRSRERRKKWWKIKNIS
jgi:hypothetical protein